MYIGIKHLHSLVAIITLLLLILAIAYAIYCRIKSKPFTKRSKKIMLFGFSAVHTQILVGLILYFVSPFGSSILSSGVMKNSISRLYAVEHPILMIVAAILVSIGYIKAKKQNLIVLSSIKLFCFIQ